MTIVTDNGVTLTPDPELIRAALEAVKTPGSPIEVRVLNVRNNGPARLFGRTYNGFYDDTDAAVRDVSRISGLDAPGVYVTINELDPIVRNWGHNRLDRSDKAASDDQIVRLRHLFIDLDPRRPVFTNATAAEHAAAMARLDDVTGHMSAEGWPLPVLAGSSGSGAMALYRIDLPPSEDGLVEATLQSLAALFDDDIVTVDTTVHNPARIARIPGTINAKSPTPQADRPWTMASARAVAS